MQTFVPVADFEESARLLDSPRLGKQRVETLQILRALELPDYGWASHPAVAMWRGAGPARGACARGRGAGAGGEGGRRLTDGVSGCDAPPGGCLTHRGPAPGRLGGPTGGAAGGD